MRRGGRGREAASRLLGLFAVSARSDLDSVDLLEEGMEQAVCASRIALWQTWGRRQEEPHVSTTAGAAAHRFAGHGSCLCEI
mmetsp:Transcript_49396/g.163616  ORF Transcript_49396/g.163616 Transcript_49396/m.163616 type:complete len:82 (+) Transcript_49396:933-1178(+)